MGMKCKKLILLTMQLNNANQKKLRYSRSKIVNMEMYFKVRIIRIIITNLKL